MRNLEDYKRTADANKIKMNRLHEECEEARRKELKKQGIIIDSSVNKQKNIYGDCDHPDTIENGTAIIFYIVAMLIGAIFKDRWIIWIVATGIYLKFITRHTK